MQAAKVYSRFACRAGDPSDLKAVRVTSVSQLVSLHLMMATFSCLLVFNVKNVKNIVCRVVDQFTLHKSSLHSMVRIMQQ